MKANAGGDGGGKGYGNTQASRNSHELIVLGFKLLNCV